LCAVEDHDVAGSTVSKLTKFFFFLASSTIIKVSDYRKILLEFYEL